MIPPWSRQYTANTPWIVVNMPPWSVCRKTSIQRASGNSWCTADGGAFSRNVIFVVKIIFFLCASTSPIVCSTFVWATKKNTWSLWKGNLKCARALDFYRGVLWGENGYGIWKDLWQRSFSLFCFCFFFIIFYIFFFYFWLCMEYDGGIEYCLICGYDGVICNEVKWSELMREKGNKRGFLFFWRRWYWCETYCFVMIIVAVARCGVVKGGIRRASFPGKRWMWRTQECHLYGQKWIQL